MGAQYRVRQCQGCGTACADPLQVDPSVYRAIYQSPENVPGYNRYAIYAAEIRKKRSPIRYLATREESYWSIIATLEQLFPDRNARILEAGCGLGYMTYALTKAGFPRVVGLDVAETAISYAKKHYGFDGHGGLDGRGGLNGQGGLDKTRGDFNEKHGGSDKAQCGFDYVVADIASYAEQAPETFDVIIMTEVIEHIEDPQGFLAHAKKLLNPGGYLICTTPNRSFGGHLRLLWATDLPPVHLWWFTEDGVRELGNKVGMQVDFVDFSPWNRRHLRRFDRAWARSLRDNQPTESRLDSLGEVIGKRRSRAKRARATLGWSLAERWRETMYRLRSKGPSDEKLMKSPILCAVFREGESSV